jgi:polyisoprenoid-binding protein YceI
MTDLIRRVHGQEVPATGVWELRPARASIQFTLHRPCARAIRGQVRLDDGVMLITADPQESVSAMSIDASSLSTSRPRRDARWRAKWLEADRYPTIDLLVDEVEQQTRWEWTALCRLRLRDTTIPIALCFTYDGVDDNDDARFRARTMLSGADLGITGRWFRIFSHSVNVEIRAEVHAQRISDLVTFASDLRYAHPSFG